MDDVYRTFHEINKRFQTIENGVKSLGSLDTTAINGFHPTSYIIDNQAILSGASLNTVDLVTLGIVPINTLGVFGMIIGTPAAVPAYLAISPKGDTPDAFSPRVNALVAGVSHSGLVMCRLGTDKALTLKAFTANFSAVYFYLTGYWK